MSIEVMLLAVMCFMTLLAYLVAINAHGPTRLSISYLIATIMLAGTVWIIVQYVNTSYDTVKMQELKRLEMEKQAAEEKAQSQERELKVSKVLLNFAAQLNSTLTEATGYASTMISADLQDKSTNLEGLMGRSSTIKQKSDDLKATFEKIKVEDSILVEPVKIIRDGLQSLSEAGYYYKSYYYSEDTQQEQLRERLLRQKAQYAYDRFQKAGSLIASSVNQP